MRLTKEQAAIVGLYTGYACGPFGDIHELAEKICGRSVWTHEFASREFGETLRKLSKPLFLSICYEVVE